jgi:hypothetical protein
MHGAKYWFIGAHNDLLQVDGLGNGVEQVLKWRLAIEIVSVHPVVSMPLSGKSSQDFNSAG